VRGELRYDAVVIGAGTAGLTAAVRLAEGGARVCVVAKGVGSTHLAPGTIDVLGYAPQRVQDPTAGIADLVAARPDHPYALLGVDAVRSALEWFAQRIAAASETGYRYEGSLERNFQLPTALGALRPSALVPRTMAAGDARAGGPVCVVGIPVLRDFHAPLCAENLTRAGIEATAVQIEVEVEGRAEANALGVARRFADPAFRAAFAGSLASRLGGADRVALPAVLPLRDPAVAWDELQARLGRKVFEIPTLPPSVPGMRLSDALRSTLRRAGGRLVLGAEVVGAEREGDRLAAVRTHAAGHDLRYRADWFILASGGFASGAIALGADWVTRETVLGLALRGAPGPGEPRFVADYFAQQPMARAGVAVGADLRAEGMENVFVAGASLPGAVPWREGSGEGIAVTSGHRAAENVLAGSGAGVGAGARQVAATEAPGGTA
jgi:glycerol-3-phosphate dehydrogenase subunit B